MNKWLGPFKVMTGDDKNVLFNLNGRIVPASVEKLTIYKPPN